MGRMRGIFPLKEFMEEIKMTEQIMNDDEIKDTYEMLVKQLSHGGRLSENGKYLVNKIDQIFRVTGSDALLFQGVVGTVVMEQIGKDATREDIRKVSASINGFFKSVACPYEKVKVDGKLMIQRKAA